VADAAAVPAAAAAATSSFLSSTSREHLKNAAETVSLLRFFVSTFTVV